MRLPFLLFVVALGGCAAPLIDYGAGTDFARYQTVRAFERADPPRSLDAARVEAALARVLPSRGLVLKDVGPSDLQVRYRFVEYSRFDVNEMFWGVGASRNNIGVGISAPVSAEESKQYRLDIELIDVRDQQVVWRARSAAALSEDARPARRESWIDKQVSKMLEAYPPAMR